MKRSSRIAVGIAASLTLGLGTAAYAHQGGMGAGAQGKAGMQHGMQGAMGHGAESHHEQMQARMHEKGMAGPRHQGPRPGAAAGPATPAQAPTTTEQHVH